jgi:hypothetical protein
MFNNEATKLMDILFAKCTMCNSLQQYIGKSTKGSSEYVDFIQ